LFTAGMFERKWNESTAQEIKAGEELIDVAEVDE
jgi:hypothetical protein